MCLKGPFARFLCLVLLLILPGCIDAPTSPQQLQPTPQSAMDEEPGIDESKLIHMMDVIDALDLPVDSVVVSQHGKIVFEEYPNPDYGPDSLHLLYSVTKSVTSALVGIAIDRGFIQDVDQKVVNFFPEWTIKNLDARKERVTIEHLLTMSCGFEWDGPDDDLHSWGEAIRSGNPVKYVLDQPMTSDPGTAWVYNGGCSHILSAILTKTTGRSTLDFAREYLFGPLGITDVRWPVDPQGIYYGGQDIQLTPRDMVRFGQLFLNRGVWEGQQIIPEDWVRASAETYLVHDLGGYGYQWWTFPQSGIYYASGTYEQKIYVIPDLDMVVAFTADNRASGLGAGEIRSRPPMTAWLLGRFILPAGNTYREREHAGYGFSLEVPVGVLAQGLGKQGQGTASERSGLLQFSYGLSPYERAGVQWDTVAASPNLAAALDAFAGAIGSMGVEINELSSHSAATREGHDLIYRALEIVDGGSTYAGFMGAWYCVETRRVYILYFASDGELREWIDPLAEFEGYLDAFSCHR